MTTESQFPAHLYDIDPEEDTALLQDVLDPADFLVKQRLRRDAKVLGQPESRVHRTLSISEEDRAQMSMVMDPVEYEIEEDVRRISREGPPKGVHVWIAMQELPKLSQKVGRKVGTRMVPGDGHCQFGSLADQMSQYPQHFAGYRSGAYPPFATSMAAAITASGRVRHEVCDWIAHHLKERWAGLSLPGAGHTVKQFIKVMSQEVAGVNGDVEKYLATMRNAEYGDEITLQAAAHLYRVKVFMYEIDNPDYSQEFAPAEEERHPEVRLLIIRRQHPMHYNSASWLDIVDHAQIMKELSADRELQVEKNAHQDLDRTCPGCAMC